MTNNRRYSDYGELDHFVVCNVAVILIAVTYLAGLVMCEKGKNKNMEANARTNTVVVAHDNTKTNALTKVSDHTSTTTAVAQAAKDAKQPQK